MSANSPYPISLRVDDVTTALYRGLGLDHGVRRRAVGEQGWAERLRAFARPVTWAVPIGWVFIALAASWQWPTPTGSSSGVSPGTWLVVMLTGLVLSVVGVMALASLLAATRARFWAIPAVFAMATGTMLLAPVLGLMALSRAAPADVQQTLVDGGAARGLRLVGLALITLGWLCAAVAVLAADVFSLSDGWLIALGALLALVGATVGSPHLVAFAALPALAGALGVAWHAGRIAPDGRLR